MTILLSMLLPFLQTLTLYQLGIAQDSEQHKICKQEFCKASHLFVQVCHVTPLRKWYCQIRDSARDLQQNSENRVFSKLSNSRESQQTTLQTSEHEQLHSQFVLSRTLQPLAIT